MEKFYIDCGLFCFDACETQAKELPTVVWTNTVYGVDNSKYQRNWHLLTQDGRKRIADAITRKLKEQTAAGKLPFKLQESSRQQNAELGANLERRNLEG